MWDWKSWLTNHMHGLTGHSEPHIFHFFHDSTGKSVIRDKAYHTQGEWSEPYQLLTSIPQGAHHPFTCATMAALSFSSTPGAPYLIPPQPFPPEVITNFTDNCDAPLFLESELKEWADIFEAHAALTASSHPTCDSSIFEGLSAHPLTNPLLDSPLFHLQKFSSSA
jgi:hypothetical protein